MEPTEHDNIPKATLQVLRTQFDLIDQDGNGSISGGELTQVMRQLGHQVTDAEVTDIMAAVAGEGDGEISFNDFVTIVGKMGKRKGDGEEEEDPQSALRAAFKVFDRQGRGYIGASDLRLVIQCMGAQLEDDEIEDIIDEVDVNGDGQIDFFEFVKAVSDD